VRRFSKKLAVLAGHLPCAWYAIWNPEIIMLPHEPTFNLQLNKA
jgi:hypothetical protein